MAKRIIFDIILFLTIFFLPWWITVATAFISMILFKKFWEGVAVFFLIDLLYSLPKTSKDWQIYGHFGIFTLTGIILFLIINKIKSNIRL